jgi:hypothetical protein
MEAQEYDIWSLSIYGFLDKGIEYFFDSEAKARQVEKLITDSFPNFPKDEMGWPYDLATIEFNAQCELYARNLAIPDLITADEILQILKVMDKYDGIISVGKLNIR